MSTNYQSDAVIIGAGIAGIVTAIELLDQSKSVTLIERQKRSRLGGLAPGAFGGMALVGSPQQKKMGIEDNPEIAYQDWCSFADFSAQDHWPKRWAHCYTHRSITDVYEWLDARGIRFFPAVNWVERGLYTPGNSVPRYHILWGTGHHMMAVLKRELLEHPNQSRLTCLFEHRVDQLTSDASGVSGCRGVDEASGQEFIVKADSVIVASGGIGGDIQKVKENWYAPWGKPPETILNGSHPYSDGRMHDEIASMGGSVTHLDKMWNYAAGIPHPQPLFDAHGLSLIPCKSALWLDHKGQRIGPDPLVTGFDTNYLCKRVSEQNKPYTWQVLNWRIAAKELAISGAEHNIMIRDRRLFSFLKESLLGNHRLVEQMQRESDHFIVRDSLPDLVQAMNQLTGKDAVKLSVIEKEIRAFDVNFERRKSMRNDDQIRRIEHARKWRPDRFRTCRPGAITAPAAGPLIAIKLNLVSRKSLGGIQTDMQSRVLSHRQGPIPGLYAVGECAGFGGGGASGFRSLEGTFLAGCILNARMAARSINGQYDSYFESSNSEPTKVKL